MQVTPNWMKVVFVGFASYYLFFFFFLGGENIFVWPYFSRPFRSFRDVLKVLKQTLADLQNDPVL